MKTSITRSDVQPYSTPQPNATPKSKAAILEEAEKLRTTLRESLDGVNGLIREIKVQRRQDKLLRDTVASLRKLQGV